MNTERVAQITSFLKVEGIATPDDVLRMRKDVFRDGIVSENEADALFSLNNSLNEACEEWNEFFIEALTEFTVFQLAPIGYVSVENSAWLMDAISSDGVVQSATELELLVKIMARAKSCPPTLVQFTMLQVSVAVLNGEGPLARGGELTQGVIGEAEVELLRTVLYAASGENSLSISKEEIEILLQLNEATQGANNHSSWQDLYVRATANYLMAVSGSKGISREAALAREAWLDDTEINKAEFFKEMVSGFGKLLTPDFFDDIFTSSHVMMEKAWKAKNSEMTENLHKSEMINLQESKWLIDRINRDGVINDNEKALLQFIGKESHSIDPSLQAMIDQVA